MRGDGTHKLGLVDAVHISSICLRQRTPHARALVNLLAADAGCMVELPPREEQPAEDLYLTVANLAEKASTAVKDIALAMRDGFVSDNELRELRRDVAVIISQAQDVLTNSERNNRANQPRSVARVA